MFLMGKVWKKNDWTNKINKNLYNKHSVTYTAQYIEHIYVNSGRYKLGEALINFGVCFWCYTPGTPNQTMPIPLGRHWLPIQTIPIPDLPTSMHCA